MEQEAERCLELGIESIRSRNWQAAEYYFLKALEMDPHERIYLCLGWLCTIQGDQSDEAFRYFRKAMQLNPECGDAYNEYGALLLRMGRLPEALRWFRKALRVRECSCRHFVLFNLALSYRKLNRPERSLRFLNLALEEDPGFVPARLLLEELSRESENAGK